MSSETDKSGFRGYFEWFVHSEVTGSILLLACTVIALVWANSPWADSYFDLLHTYVGVSWGDVAFKLSLHRWINDGLMVVFFFVVGLEIKRELVVGELSSFNKAALPVMAAIGGMVVPAVLFFVLNTGGEGTYNMRGGILNADHISIAFNGDGYLNVTGGTINVVNNVTIGSDGTHPYQAWVKVTDIDDEPTLTTTGRPGAEGRLIPAPRRRGTRR